MARKAFSRSILACVSASALSLIVLISTARAAVDPSQPGSFDFQTAEYKFPATVDKEVLETNATEIWARAFWPKDLSQPRPIVFLLHGNHPTCGQGTPRRDKDCKYTNEGVCPVGQVVVPNHEGYNYLGKQLASQGFIVVSINANRGITCGSGNSDDWGLNLARGRLVLRHIEQWQKWATQGGAPASLGVAPNAFVGHVDIANVGLMGHSRGGEGMRAAYNLYREKKSIWTSKIPGLQIRGIFEIGAVDGQTGRVLDADDTAWNAVLPMCDGDVSDLEGRMPFERMISKSNETRKTPKSISMVYGANHNFFNTEWLDSDSVGCQGHDPIFGTGTESIEQQKVASTEMTAFFLANVGSNKAAEHLEVFDPRTALPKSLTDVTRIDRDHIYTYDQMFSTVVDDFDQPTGQSSNRKSNLATGITVDNVRYSRPFYASIKWSETAGSRFFQTNWADPNKGRDTTAYTSLDFRVGRQQDQVSEPATDFSVQLVDQDSNVSAAVAVSQFINLTGPGNATNLFQTVRIPMQLFGLKPQAKIQGIRFNFDRSPKGAINLANVRFTRNDPTSFLSSISDQLAPIDIASEDDKVDDPFQANVNDLSNWLPANENQKKAAATSKVIQKVSEAKFWKANFVQNSPYLRGESGYEVAVQAKKNFPAQDALPILNIGGNQFGVSRYPSNGKTDVLIFSINAYDFQRLPTNASAQVQYGKTNPSKIWKMPNFDKSKLAY